MARGAIILCGGESRRMGRDKATLAFGPETLLQRVVRLLSEVVPLGHMVVVAAPRQTLPDLPCEVRIARDPRSHRGPLEGLTAGLRELSADVDMAYATACDVPFLAPRFVERMFELLGEHDIAVPYDGEFSHPLAAVYRARVLSHAQRLLDADRLRLRGLFDEVDTRRTPVAELRAVDPQLATLENLNRPEDYQQALDAAGFG